MYQGLIIEAGAITLKQDLALAKVGLTPSDNRYFVNWSEVGPAFQVGSHVIPFASKTRRCAISSKVKSSLSLFLENDWIIIAHFLLRVSIVSDGSSLSPDRACVGRCFLVGLIVIHCVGWVDVARWCENTSWCRIPKTRKTISSAYSTIVLRLLGRYGFYSPLVLVRPRDYRYIQNVSPLWGLLF